ncbi:hypothetical protein B0H12DRAFT_1230724 [Mycena haematopus]|nr:hypothetical protein B0H12DRAFT_1230724 [Mycena haematopus]
MSPRRVRFSETVDEFEHKSEVLLNTPILHSSLRPNECEPLDFSLPSVLLRADPPLDLAVLNEPACAPLYPEVHIRVPSADGTRGLCIIALPIPCTVGDVLTTLHDNLRQPESSNGWENDLEWYHTRRVDTLPNYCAASTSPVGFTQFPWRLPLGRGALICYGERSFSRGLSFQMTQSLINGN